MQSQTLQAPNRTDVDQRWRGFYYECGHSVRVQRPGQRGGGQGCSVTPVQVLPEAAASYLRRSWHVPTLRELPQGRSVESDGGVLPASHVCLRALLSGAI